MIDRIVQGDVWVRGVEDLGRVAHLLGCDIDGIARIGAGVPHGILPHEIDRIVERDIHQCRVGRCFLRGGVGDVAHAAGPGTAAGNQDQKRQPSSIRKRPFQWFFLQYYIIADSRIIS